MSGLGRFENYGDDTYGTSEPLRQRLPFSATLKPLQENPLQD